MGLGIAGMTQPAKVIGFLDIFGRWDFSLAFVMGGAVGVHLITYRLIRRRSRPLADERWHVPTKTQITPRLMMGAVIFGAGWGLGGFCPGPALVSLATGEMKPLIFVAAMAIGMMLYRAIEPKVPWAK
jgi:hypothetical protein